MHKVERNEAPQELVEKNKIINQNIDNYDINKEWSKFSSTDLKKETLNRLKEMFKGCCAYCEGKFDDSSYPQIDHFKPKSLFPEFCFDYNNMNYSCEKCNMYKRDKYDEKLINPTYDNPEEHLKFKGVYLTSLDERGNVTLDLLGINLEDRLEKKKEKYNTIREKIETITNVLKEITTNLNSFNEQVKVILDINIKDIERAFDINSEYSTMIRHNFEKDYMYIKEISKKLDNI